MEVPYSNDLRKLLIFLHLFYLILSDLRFFREFTQLNATVPKWRPWAQAEAWNDCIEYIYDMIIQRFAPQGDFAPQKVKNHFLVVWWKTTDLGHLRKKMQLSPTSKQLAHNSASGKKP